MCPLLLALLLTRVNSGSYSKGPGVSQDGQYFDALTTIEF
jgi:hypothetical protein